MTDSADAGAPVELSVVLPSYHEAENLAVLLPDIVAVARSLAEPSEVIVVDTVTPTDETPDLCERDGARYLPREGGDDYGNAIRTGIAASRGRWVVIMDVDGSHDPAFMRELWGCKGSADVVIASRYVPSGSTDNPALLVLFSKILNAIFALVLRMQVQDISNSYRLYDGEMLRGLELLSAHFDIQEEILGQLLWSRETPATIVEIPFSFHRRLHGTSKRSLLVFGLAFLAAMGRLRVMKRRLVGRRRMSAATRPGA